MRNGFKSGVCALAFLTLTQSVAQAAVSTKCANTNEVSALKTASVQQTLMNAGLGCGTNETETRFWVGKFNAFQTAYLMELRKTDAMMLSMFKRVMGGPKGDAAYNAFKTKVANAAGLRRVNAMQNFCKAAEEAFTVALAPVRPNLADFVAAITVEDPSPVEACQSAGPKIIPRPRPDRPGELPYISTAAPVPAAVTATTVTPALPTAVPAVQ
jgi:hypothetical protein